MRIQNNFTVELFILLAKMDSDVAESQENSSGNPEATSSNDKSTRHDRITRLPLTGIKSIIKTDPDVTLASQESVLLIAKATVQLAF